jgi:hypothetical protein
VTVRAARRAVLVAAALGAAAGAAHGSISIGTSPTGATLRVDARGNAAVAWRSSGAAQSVTVPPKGQLVHGALPGADVSRRVAPNVPLALVERRTPDGRLWALQSWQVAAGGPVELHLARWRGAPTKLTLATDGTHVTGTVTFHGRPVSGYSSTLEGKRLRIYVYVDCFACNGGGGWTRMLGVPPQPDGSFSVLLRPEWTGTRYRATVAGPNLGAILAPDAQATIAASG